MTPTTSKAFARLTTARSTIPTVRRIPIWTSRSWGRLHDSKIRRIVSGKTGISQTHQEKCQVFQS
jgi:hypothetical protein